MQRKGRAHLLILRPGRQVPAVDGTDEPLGHRTARVLVRAVPRVIRRWRACGADRRVETERHIVGDAIGRVELLEDSGPAASRKLRQARAGHTDSNIDAPEFLAGRAVRADGSVEDRLRGVRWVGGERYGSTVECESHGVVSASPRV